MFFHVAPKHKLVLATRVRCLSSVFAHCVLVLLNTLLDIMTHIESIRRKTRSESGSVWLKQGMILSSDRMCLSGLVFSHDSIRMLNDAKFMHTRVK